ncbi:MAG: 2-C-methyl-D-erythritol 2,4-cyclodiphosphate synthase [Oscillospiraceae bacterium]|jgi:2-C-methyl-D-erythritol 2,4-cyclodiphosphate synthase|nr:2-C-methyl-D-erythritol 2,4-cyclodiphosphate synthase [Oscillospiraceae bacterium]
MRIGHGYDAHRLVDEKKLVLGGVVIPHEKGLLGHSDADVLTHAIIDSLLGAAGMSDIGKLFPDSDPSFSDADSIKFLKSVCLILLQSHFAICNIDCTIIAQKPKLSEYISAMKTKISSACEISEHQINIKATTEEGLGFTGNGQGICAHSVALIQELPPSLKLLNLTQI